MATRIPHTRSVRLSEAEIDETVRAWGIPWPAGAELVEALQWTSRGESEVLWRKIWVKVPGATDGPVTRIWIARLERGRWALLYRPVTADELAALLVVLREVGAPEDELAPPIGDAGYGSETDFFDIVPTPLEAMIERRPYRRYGVRFHADGRPASVGYFLETRQGSVNKTLPGGGVLRGTPYEH